MSSVSMHVHSASCKIKRVVRPRGGATCHHASKTAAATVASEVLNKAMQMARESSLIETHADAVQAGAATSPQYTSTLVVRPSIHLSGAHIKACMVHGRLYCSISFLELRFQIHPPTHRFQWQRCAP
jgi:hypothetical protein